MRRRRILDILTLLVPSLAVSLTPASAGDVPAPHSFTAEQRSYWALQTVTRPMLPAVHNSGWVRNPIDSFVVAQLEAKGLMPSAPAGRVTLLRRVSLDLIGLPPT